MFFKFITGYLIFSEIHTGIHIYLQLNHSQNNENNCLLIIILKYLISKWIFKKKKCMRIILSFRVSIVFLCFSFSASYSSPLSPFHDTRDVIAHNIHVYMYINIYIWNIASVKCPHSPYYKHFSKRERTYQL